MNSNQKYTFNKQRNNLFLIISLLGMTLLPFLSREPSAVHGMVRSICFVLAVLSLTNSFFPFRSRWHYIATFTGVIVVLTLYNFLLVVLAHKIFGIGTF